MRVLNQYKNPILILSILFLLVAMCAMLWPGVVANADIPMPPQVFRGTVTTNGVLAGAGVTVTVKSGNAAVSSTITDNQGRYGYVTDFMASANPGASLDFYVNGQTTGQSYTFSSGSITTLNLVLGASNLLPSSTRTITTSMLGQAGSFNLSQSGTVSASMELSSAEDAVRILLNSNTAVNIQGQALIVTSSTLAPPAAPANTVLIKIFDFAPNNTTFSPAINVILKYGPAALPEGVAESNLYVAFWDGSAWQPVASTVNTVGKTVTAQVSHFTLYAVLGGIGSNVNVHPYLTTPPALITSPATTTTPASTTPPTATTPPASTTAPASTTTSSTVTTPSTSTTPSSTSSVATSLSTTTTTSAATTPIVIPPAQQAPAETASAAAPDNSLLTWGLIAAGVLLIILFAVILIKRRSY